MAGKSHANYSAVLLQAYSLRPRTTDKSDSCMDIDLNLRLQDTN